MSAFDSAISLPTVSTGTSLVVGSQKLTDNQQQATPMSAMDSLRAVFDDMRYALESIAINTFETNELLKTGAVGKSQQERDKGIREGETDVPPVAEEKGPGILASLGNTLSNLNPFKDGMSPIMKFLLAGAALIGLKVFGEKLNEPLANLVKMFKEGTIVDNIKKTVENIKKDLEPIILDIKEGFGRFIEGVTAVFNIIKSAYEMVEKYVMSFDTQGAVGPAGMPIGDGKLDPTELGNLKKDVIDKITDAIVQTVKNVAGQLADGIKGIFLLPVTLGLAMAAIKNAILGPAVKPPQGPTKGGTPVKARGGILRGILGKAGLVAAVTFGIFELIDKSKEAYADAITDEMGKKQNFDFSEMIGSFFGGDGKGIFNSFGEMFKQGAIGTAVGAGLGLTLAKLGFVIGTPFGPLGMGTGALLGFLVGSLVGAIGGYFGGAAISKLLDDFGSMISDVGDTIFNYFSDLVDSIKTFFTGGPSKKAADEKRLNEELTDLNKDLEYYQKLVEKDPNYMPFVNKVEKLEKKIEDKKKEISNVPLAQAELTAGVTLEGVGQNIDDKEFQIQVQKDLLNRAKTGQGIFMSKDDQDQLENVIIPRLENELIELKKTENKLKEVSTTGDVVLKTDVVPSKFDTVDASDRTGSSFNFTPIHTNSNNTNVKGGDNVYTGGLREDNPHFTALIMAHKKAQTT